MKAEFYKEKLDNGLTILFEKRKQNVVSVSSSVKEGSAFETEKEKGISHFIEHLMFKGTKTRSYKEIAEEIEKKGGILNAFTAEEFTSYWAKLPKKHFSIGSDIVRDLILNPKFDKKEFEKEKRVILEEIKMYHDNPALYVIDKIKSLVYKKPFGLSALGGEKNIIGLTRDKVKDYFEKKYTTNKMIFCVVGNTDFEDVKKEAEKFPKKTAREEELKAERIGRRNVIEFRKGLKQAHLVIGIPFDIKDRYAFDIFNTYLAYGMSSKLFEEIREKKGLAYHIRGNIECGKGYSYQVIYIGTTKEKVKLCKDIVLKEIRKIKKLEKKDFDEVKEQLIGLRDIAIENSEEVMTALVNEEILGNAYDFYKYEDFIMDVKLSEIREIGKIKNFSFLTLIPK